MTQRQSMTRLGTVRGAGRAGKQHAERPAPRLARSHPAGGGFGPADRHRSDPPGPVPDRVPDDPDDRVAVPAAGDRRLRPRAGRAGHPRPAVVASRLAAAAGAGFALATLGGYLLSVWTGLFGFKEVRTTAGIAAGADRGGRLRGPGRARACSRPGERPGGPTRQRPRPDSPPGSPRRPPGRPE